MTFEEAVKYFGTQYKMCIALDIAPQNATAWKKRGHIPFLQQFRISQLSNGELVPDEVDPRTRKNSYEKGRVEPWVRK